jgi:hypothetical protein
MSGVSKMKPHVFDDVDEAKAGETSRERFQLLWARLALWASFGLIVLICFRFP